MGWHASPKSARRPFEWTQLDRGFRSIRRHLNVDLTDDRSFWTLETTVPLYSAAVVSASPKTVTYRGSKSAKSARILSPLPSSVHDSTDPSSGWSNTRLYSF